MVEKGYLGIEDGHHPEVEKETRKEKMGFMQK